MRSCASLTVLVLALTGCDWIDAATAEHPNATQRDAIGDVFGSFGAFISVVSDPAAASDGDFADMHATTPYAAVLDPEGQAAARRLGAPQVSPDGCAAGADGEASWDCDVQVEGSTCHVLGSGSENSPGHYSGTSTLTCPGFAARVIATDLQFDKAAGAGSGRVQLYVGTLVENLADYADVTITDMGFCVDEPTPAPNSGELTIDGLGELDGKPYDPLTLEFTDTPDCGVINIK